MDWFILAEYISSAMLNPDMLGAPGNFLKLRVPSWGTYIKDYSIWGSMLEPPYFGKLPNILKP